MMELSKTYDQTKVEGKWYKIWEESGFFSPDGPTTAHQNTNLGKFVIVIPPPNVTGSLHMGHALDNTLQDILIRFRRMQGYKTLWVPGTDHAGIATQNVVEKDLSKEKKKKEDIGREEFEKRVWKWKGLYGSTITKQLRRLGASCDWKRERFTMDEGLSKAVRKAFVSLYKEGLIYRGKRMVNWCPRCKTAISDIEVEHETRKGKLWYIKYKVAGNQKPAAGTNDFVVVATTRPETMLGDTAVAVNPDDERYKHLTGKNLILPLVNRIIPVIADEFVDPSFGTGAVKVTPAHDPNDFDMGARHNLPKINILTKDAKITLEEFSAEEKKGINGIEGLERQKAREAIVKALEENGSIEKIEDYENSAGSCYRCKTVIEPSLSDQWFVKVASLAEKAIEAVEQKKIEFIPSRWSKVYTDWMMNLKDWCISRQIWWGHRIPVWYCACGEVIVSEADPEKCPACGGKSLSQDEDVLDTWFSSSLWPFSTLGWPQKTKDLETYYPTSALITGYDIITFWVSKMIMMGLHFMGSEPFGKVFIHGLIRDISGKKMSKSLGNVIDPIDVIERVGADALRFALTSLVTSGGQDLKLTEEKITEGRNFANKIWNVSRFVLMQGEAADTKFDTGRLTVADKWILSRFNRTIGQTTKLLEEFEFGEAARRLYEFIWSEFCDWFVELSKQSIYDQSPNKENTLKVLKTVLLGTVKLLHPFMPFETEEIFSIIGGGKTIMLSDWPDSNPSLIDEKTEAKVALMIEIIRSIRNIRAEMNVPPNKEISAIISAGGQKDVVRELLPYMISLAKASKIEVLDRLREKPEQSASAVVSNIEIYVPLEGLIDFEKEKERLQKHLDEMDALISRTKEKLENKDFTGRAKPELVDAEKEKLKEYQNKKTILEERIKTLK
ncbi:MAG: valine--tRNA ligase [Candidatus Saganbacteria bacterium]|nr:valine--tRNA ligase [Candidatus Saganbacteria bacterium]